MSDSQSVLHGRKPFLCRVGIHTRNHVELGDTPSTTFRFCICGAKWRGTYDGIEPGWERLR